MIKGFLFAGFKKIIANKGYEGEIQLLSDPCHPAASTRCLKNCSRCLQHMHNSVPDKEISSKRHKNCITVNNIDSI